MVKLTFLLVEEGTTYDVKPIHKFMKSAWLSLLAVVYIRPGVPGRLGRRRVINYNRPTMVD